MLGIQRELSQLVLEHSFTNIYRVPTEYQAAYALSIIAETFIEAGPNLRHTTNPTGHALGKFI